MLQSSNSGTPIRNPNDSWFREYGRWSWWKNVWKWHWLKNFFFYFQSRWFSVWLKFNLNTKYGKSIRNDEIFVRVSKWTTTKNKKLFRLWISNKWQMKETKMNDKFAIYPVSWHSLHQFSSFFFFFSCRLDVKRIQWWRFHFYSFPFIKHQTSSPILPKWNINFHYVWKMNQM